MKILLSHLKETTPIWIPQKKNIKTLDNQTNRYMKTKHLILAVIDVDRQIFCGVDIAVSDVGDIL